MKITQSRINSRRLTFIVMLLFIALLSAGSGSEISAVKAMLLFDNENYAEAEKIFLLLLQEAEPKPDVKLLLRCITN